MRIDFTFLGVGFAGWQRREWSSSGCGAGCRYEVPQDVREAPSEGTQEADLIFAYKARPGGAASSVPRLHQSFDLSVGREGRTPA